MDFEDDMTETDAWVISYNKKRGVIPYLGNRRIIARRETANKRYISRRYERARERYKE